MIGSESRVGHAALELVIDRSQAWFAGEQFAGIGRNARSTLSFSSRTRSASSETGGSIAIRQSNCSR